MGLAALVALCLIYAGTLTAVQSTRPVAAQEAPSATQPTGDAAGESSGDAAGAATPSQADAGELDDTFWSEFDRLSQRDAPSPASSQPASGDDLSGLAGQLAFSLILVAGLAYAGIWGFKQYSARQGGQVSFSGQLLAVQESRNLGPNQVLHVVRMGEETLLLGATAHTISCLARYGGEQLPEPFGATLQAQMSAPTAISPATSLAPSPVAEPVQPPRPPSLQESLERLRQSQQRWQEGRRNG